MGLHAGANRQAGAALCLVAHWDASAAHADWHPAPALPALMATGAFALPTHIVGAIWPGIPGVRYLGAAATAARALPVKFIPAADRMEPERGMLAWTTPGPGCMPIPS